MGLFKRINQGLKKTRDSMSGAINAALYGKNEIDDEFYEDLEEILVMADAGVTLTSVGATYPYGIDPEDKNLRIAPTYPTDDEVRSATEILVLTVKLAAVEKLQQQGYVNDESFCEDPLRVLRAAQFAARFSFSVADETAETEDAAE